MKIKYSGSLAHLQNLVQDCSVFGEWRPLEPVGSYQFRSTSGEIMNWWPSTGTVFFQGRPGPLQPRLTAVLAHPVADDEGIHIVNSRALFG